MERQYLAQSLGDICAANLKTPDCKVFNHHCALAEPLIKVFAEKAMKSKGSAALEEEVQDGIWKQIFNLLCTICRFLWRCLMAKTCPLVSLWRWALRRNKGDKVKVSSLDQADSEKSSSSKAKTFSEAYESDIYYQDRYAEMWHAFRLGDVGGTVQDLQALLLSHQMVQ